MARFIHPLLDTVKADGKLKTGVLTNGTFEAGLELPLLDEAFDDDSDLMLDDAHAAPVHLFGGHMEWQAYE